MASSMSFNALKLAPLVVAVLLLIIGASHAFTKTAARPNSQTSPQQRGISLAPKSANSDVAEEGMVVEEITSVSQFNTILTGIETYPYPKKSYTQENFKRKMQGLPPLEEEIPEGVKIDQEVILKVGAGFCPACRYVGPRFHKLAAVHGGGGGGGGGGGEEGRGAAAALAFAELTTEEFPDLLSDLKVKGVPYFMFFRGGELVAAENIKEPSEIEPFLVRCSNNLDMDEDGTVINIAAQQTQAVNTSPDDVDKDNDDAARLISAYSGVRAGWTARSCYYD